MKKLIIFTILSVLIVSGCTNPFSRVSTFDECVEAGGQILESFPRECVYKNKSYVEDITLQMQETQNTINQVGDGVDKTDEVELDEYQQDAINAAQEWIMQKAPTYVFDGYDLKYTKIQDVKCPLCYAVTFTFKSQHAGYGDRTGQVLAQVITDHSMELFVRNGKVLNAITDDSFDEMK